MDRNYPARPGSPGHRSTHVLVRLKSDIPAEADLSRSSPDGSYAAELFGDGVTVTVRVVEYWVTVEGQEVPEMFCLVTDLMDWEDYPAAELAALYRWRWDGSETALREAKASAATAPAVGRADAPLGLPGPGPAGTRGLGRRQRDDPRRRPAPPRLAAVPPGKGRRAGMPVQARETFPRPRRRAVLSAIRARARPAARR